MNNGKIDPTKGDLKFTRRRYGGRQTYCWAFVYHPEEGWISLGDPWPGVNWPKKELKKAAEFALSGTRFRDMNAGDMFTFKGQCIRYEYRGEGWYGWPYSGGPWQTDENPMVIVEEKEEPSIASTITA